MTRMKTKWIAGVVVLCFLSAITASGLTVLMLVRGFFGPSWLKAIALSAGTAFQTEPTTATGIPSQTTESTPASDHPSSPTAKPTITLPPSPIPVETLEPTSAPTTRETTTVTDPTAMESSVTPAQTDETDQTDPTSLSGETTATSEPDGTTETGETDPEQKPTGTAEPTRIPTPKPSVQPSQPVDQSTDGGEVIALWANTRLIERLYEDVAPSVVGIKVTVTDGVTGLIRSNEGSGLILDTRGTIATNTAILALALDKNGKLLSNASVQVFVRGAQRPFAATLTGKDPLSGLSILDIQPGMTGLKPAVMAVEPDLKVGQLVLTIGYPDMLDGEGGLASGMISGLNRTVLLENGITTQMIETDARINSICSGGPLLNLQGEVIGLVNCDLSRSYFDNANYALPASTLVEVAESLSDRGYLSGRPWLGITVLTEESFIELQYLYRFPDGLYVSSVVADSPAYSAGLLSGDVITKINGDEIKPDMDLSAFLQTQKVGSLLTVHVFRRGDNQIYIFKVYLQEYRR